jgi:hypothetical protein
MNLAIYSFGSPRRLASTVAMLLATVLLFGVLPLMGESVSTTNKRIIGSTARIKEVSTGLEFASRIDTGAQSSSIHVDKWEIKDPAPKPVDNIGKSIRFMVSNDEGESEWIETIVAGRVRIRSSAQNEGAYHGRYKVRLTFEWDGFKKEVEVSLTDREGMEYPLLIGRNYLRGDFLVDVEKDSDD